MTIIVDELLLGTDKFPLLRASGYDWTDGIQNQYENVDTNVALLFAELQRHSRAFELGGYIEDFDAVMDKALASHPYLNAGGSDDKKYFSDVIQQKIAKVPYVSWLGHVSPHLEIDLSLVLSVYGKISSKLPETKKAQVFPSDVQGGFDARMGKDLSLIQRAVNMVSLNEKNRTMRGEVTLYEVGQAAVDTVECYVRSIEAGELSMTNKRAENVIGGVGTLVWLIEEDYPLQCYDDEPHDSLIRVSRELADVVGLKNERRLTA
ncbi:hypothetical protein G6L37_03470 [Agrobacterium rubi]|nr:hypothetical protein [Agrobacterium rubi]NTF24431.1 hypothetical protein [Agrobacterium rubi]